VAFDAKKTRLSVPSSFRAVLAKNGDPDDVVLRPSSHSPCIDVWPKATFQAEVERRTKDLDPFSQEFDEVTDELTVRAHDVRLDGDGRIVVPRPLLADVPLDAHAVIVGRRSFFQIWPAPTWAERQAAKPQPGSPRGNGGAPAAGGAPA
jgi:transcriptional regulator MraZ